MAAGNQTTTSNNKDKKVEIRFIEFTLPVAISPHDRLVTGRGKRVF